MLLVDRTVMDCPLLEPLPPVYAWWLETQPDSKHTYVLALNMQLLQPVTVQANKAFRTYDKNNFEHKAISHVCLDPGGDTVALPQSACAEMRTQTFFPSCWDGTNLDSADHKSHMAFPAIGDYNGGVCPQSHPHAIVSVFTEFFHNTRQVTAGNFNRWVYAEGDAVGYGLRKFYSLWAPLNHIVYLKANILQTPIMSKAGPTKAGWRTPWLPALAMAASTMSTAVSICTVLLDRVMPKARAHKRLHLMKRLD